MANMLSQATPVAGPAQSNPLAQGPQNSAPNPQMPQINPDEIPDHIDMGNYIMPMLVKLLQDPKVSRKDVIKTVGTAISDDKVKPTEAVKFLTDVPDDPVALRPWLKQKYGHLVAGMVHLHAAQHVLNARQAAAQQAVQTQQQAVQAATPPMQGQPNVGQ